LPRNSDCSFPAPAQLHSALWAAMPAALCMLPTLCIASISLPLYHIARIRTALGSACILPPAGEGRLRAGRTPCALGHAGGSCFLPYGGRRRGLPSVAGCWQRHASEDRIPVFLQRVLKFFRNVHTVCILGCFAVPFSSSRADALVMCIVLRCCRAFAAVLAVRVAVWDRRGVGGRPVLRQLPVFALRWHRQLRLALWCG